MPDCLLPSWPRDCRAVTSGDPRRAKSPGRFLAMTNTSTCQRHATPCRPARAPAHLADRLEQGARALAAFAAHPRPPPSGGRACRTTVAPSASSCTTSRASTRSRSSSRRRSPAAVPVVGVTMDDVARDERAHTPSNTPRSRRRPRSTCFAATAPRRLPPSARSATNRSRRRPPCPCMPMRRSPASSCWRITPCGTAITILPVCSARCGPRSAAKGNVRHGYRAASVTPTATPDSLRHQGPAAGDVGLRRLRRHRHHPADRRRAAVRSGRPAAPASACWTSPPATATRPWPPRAASPRVTSTDYVPGTAGARPATR